MSIKENLDYVKQELNSEEKFFESVVKAEGFYKKYKKIIYTSVGLLVFIGAGYKINSYISNQNAIKANMAYNTLLENPTDKKALKTLKDSSNALYQLYSLTKAIDASDTKKLQKLQKSNIDFIQDIASYEIAEIDMDKNKLKQYSLKNKVIYKELADLELAVKEIEAKQYASAKELLSSINKDSVLYKQALLLKHFLVTK